MKTLKEVLENYDEYAKQIEKRFYIKFDIYPFLTCKQLEECGFRYTGSEGRVPARWNEKNILAMLKLDVLYGYDYCIRKKDYPAETMYEFVKAWCKVLENGLDKIPYQDFGREMFEKVASRYGWSEELAQISGT